jgi:hypothetical protein
VQNLQGANRARNVEENSIMKRVLTFVAMAAFWCSFVSLGLAGDEKGAKSPDNKPLQAKSEVSAAAQVRAAIHRTMAELIEAQGADAPDQAKIDGLTKRVQELRGKLQGMMPAAAGAGGGWGCPWGGPGMGYGRGWGGGQGRGPGAGRGAGFGPGAGRGPGRGFGPGAGMGFGPGGGLFVDEDKDGICDYYELRHGMHK